MSDNGNGNLAVLGCLCSLFAIFALYLGSQSHYIPRSERPRITVIPDSDPAVLAFEKFASEHDIRWSISPDSFDGTSYCATWMQRKTYYNGIGCGDTLEKATADAIADYESQKLQIGSEEKP